MQTFKILYSTAVITFLILTAGCSSGSVPTVPKPPKPPEPPKPTVNGLVEVTPSSLNFQPSDVFVAGDYAYVRIQNTMTVYDITDPVNPVLVGGLTDYPGLRLLTTDGKYVFGVKSSTLHIFDADQPGLPVEVGSVEILENCSATAIEGDYAYITDSHSSMQIVDINPPESAYQVNLFYTIQRVRALTVVNGIAYLGTTSYGLQIIDVKNPMAPEILNTIDYDAGIRSIDVRDGYAYFGLERTRFVVMDVGSPKDAYEVTTLDISCYGESEIQGDYVYTLEVGEVGSSHTILNIIDISIPSSATVIHTVNIQGDYRKLSLRDGYAYAVDYTEGLRIIDLDPPGSAQVVNTMYSIYNPNDVEIDGGRAYVTDYSSMKIMDIAYPESTTAIGSVPVDRIKEIIVKDDYAYLLLSESFVIVDLQNIDSDPIVIETERNNYLKEMAVESGYALILNNHQELQIYDVNPPETAHVVLVLELESRPDAIAVEGGYCYLSGVNEFPSGVSRGLTIIDFTNPGSPEVISTIELSGDFGFTEIIARDDRVYVASSSGHYQSDGGGYLYNIYTDNYLDIFDVSDPASPVLVNTVDIPAHADDIVLNDGSIYLAGGSAGLVLVDISMPGSEHYVDDFAIDGWADRIAVDDLYAYVIGSGFHIYRLDEWGN